MPNFDRAREFFANAASGVRASWSALDAFAEHVDPNDDPDAEPLRARPVVILLAAVGFSVWLILRWKVQPMQDLGHHIALSAVIADYGRPGSLYTSLYEPIDPFAANSLLYQCAGRLGRWIGVMNAMRGGIVFYVAGVPLANLYALRVFGRSPWAAVLAVPLVYGMNFVAGFANLLFAAPFMLLILPMFYRALRAPTWKRVVATAIVFALLFLAHAHLFLWTGVLCATMACAFMVHGLSQRSVTLRDRALDCVRKALVAVAIVAPSLVIFAHWYSRTFGAGRNQGGIAAATSGIEDHFGAYFSTKQALMSSLIDNVGLELGEKYGPRFVYLLCVVAVIQAFARLHRFRRPPVLELAFVITALSYFVLPDGLKGHDVIAQRQPSIALWLIPAMASPIPRATSRVARGTSIGLILLLTGTLLYGWFVNLRQFEKEEAYGLSNVLAAAPPRLRLHYERSAPTSKYFGWHPFWHVDKIYMGEKFGQIPDTPGILSTSAIRYRAGVQIHRVVDNWGGWVTNEEVYTYFDLCLTRGWTPPPAMREGKTPHWRLLRESGDWQLWRSDAPPPVP